MAQITVKINGDATGFKRVVADAETLVNKLAKKSTTVVIKGDATGFANAVNKASKDLDTLIKKAASVKISTGGVSSSSSASVNASKIAAQQAKADAEAAKARAAEAKARAQEAKARAAEANASAAERKAVVAEMKSVGSLTEELTSKFGSLGYTAANALQKIGKAIVNNVINHLKEGIEELKEVENELVTIRKVTDADTDTIQAIKTNAYKTAGEYGLSASDILNSTAAFAKAGYDTETAQALAELSAKAQLVGDMTADTANQMLLAVDAAYQYKGSIESLSAVLDGMNEIDNNFATSISDISEGLGKVSTIAYQTHVGVDELSAALGTITAVTQRSGSEAATALRAIMLNIVGDTKTEIEDGATWTAGEIKGMRDIIMKYMPEMVAEAEEAGEVLNPMEVIGAFAQAYKDGTLTEAELMSELSDIGGKLRTSQLLALVQNWDMYESMLGSYATSFGSAEKEVENALDSWDAKAKQLENSWDELTASLVNTGFVKGALTTLNAIVQTLTGVPGTIAIITAAVVALTIAVKALYTAIASGGEVGFWSGLKQSFSWFATALNGWAWKIGVIVAGAALLVSIFQKLAGSGQSFEDRLDGVKANIQEYEKQKTVVEETTDELEEQKKKLKELESLTRNRTTAEQQELTQLRLKTAQLEAQLSIQEKLLLTKQRAAAKSAFSILEELGISNTYDTYGAFQNTSQFYHSGEFWWSDISLAIDSSDIFNQLAAYEAAVKEFNSAVDTNKAGFGDDDEDSLGNYADAVTELQEQISTKIETLKEYKELFESIIGDTAFDDLDDSVGKPAKLFLDSINAILDKYKELIDATEEGGTSSGKTALETAYEQAQALESKLKDLKDAWDSIGDGQDKGDAFESLKDKWQDAFDMADAGKYGSNKLIEFLDTVFPNLIKDHGGNVKEAADEVFGDKFLSSLFGEDGTAYDKLKLLLANADKLKGISISENENGSIDFSVTDIDAFADSLGTTTDVIYGFLDALNLYNKEKDGGFVFDTGEEQEEVQEPIVTASETAAETLVTASETVADNIESAAETAAETIENAFSADEESGGGSGDNGEAGSDESESKPIEIAVAVNAENKSEIQVIKEELSEICDAEHNVKITVTADNEDAKTKLSDITAEVETLDGRSVSIDVAVNVDNADAVEKIQTVSDKLEGLLNQGAEVEAGLENDSGGEPVEEVVEFTEAVEAVPEEAETTVSDNFTEEQQKLNKLESDLQDLDGSVFSTTFKLNVIKNIGGNGAPSDAAFEIGNGLASGTTYAPGGLSLVNEEGPELISQNGKAFIANGGKPALVSLDRGAIVLNANQTKGALAGRSINTSVNAYSSGFDSNLVYTGTFDKPDNYKPNSSGKGSSKSTSSSSAESSTKTSLSDYFSAVEKYYNYVLTWSDRYIGRISYQLELLQNEWDDLREPIDDEIEALEDINDKLSRQVTLLERERDALTAPINEQIEAMEKAKEIVDEEEELEEKRLAVEEARAALESANQERTIRYWNKEKGQWEWIADQDKIKSAEETLAEAEKDLADYEYEMEITALERQVESIEEEYQQQIDVLDEQQQANEDKIYDLQQQLAEIEDYYESLMEPLEKQQTALERQEAAWAEEWAERELTNTLYPEYDGTMALREALAGTPFESSEIQDLLNRMGQALNVTWLKFDDGGVANGKGLLAKAVDEPEIVLPPSVTEAVLSPNFTPQTDRLLAGLGVMFGASGSLAGGFTSLAGQGGNTDNSNTYVINGLTLGSEMGEMKVKDLFSSLKVYAAV